jgi:hypothetical protein
MSMAEVIFERASALPAERQAEALNFVDFLLAQEQARTEGTGWAAFSTSQLAHHYGPQDAVYDAD